MKIVSVIALCIVMLFSCSPQKSKKAIIQNEEARKSTEAAPLLGRGIVFTFEHDETGKLPTGWSQYFTGRSEVTDWKVVDDNGNKALAQLSMEDVGGHFNVAVFDGFKAKNVELNVRLKGIKGKRDQGGGFVWRFTDADNYYIVRANPLEDNVVLYKMENGKRTDLPLIRKGRTYGVDVAPLGNDWNDLRLVVVDDLFTVYLNNKEIFQVKDDTFSKAGKVGFWTKADAVTYFDDFEVVGK